MTLAKDIASHPLENSSRLPQTRGAFRWASGIKRRFIRTTV